MTETRPIKNKYFNHNKLTKLKQCSFKYETGCINIRCYDNGRFHVCPNPNREDVFLAEEAEFMMGKYMDDMNYTIPLKDFNNQSNWDS